MGLLDIVGGVLGGQPGQGQGGGGLGDLAAMLGQGGAQGGTQGGQAALLQMVLGMLVNSGQGGGQGGAGLGALLQQFQAAGLGEQVNSWVGTGQNLSISPEQLQGAFGADQMSQMAEKMGLSTGDLGAQLSQMLPQVVDQLTPNGQMPSGDLGNLGDLLGGLLRR
jgi:uncharacterized protein YidB (DUF937 family)